MDLRLHIRFMLQIYHYGWKVGERLLEAGDYLKHFRQSEATIQGAAII